MKKYCYDYPRPAVCVDVILISESNKVLLIQRKNEPFADFWAFPGGFVDENEDLLDAAIRELEEETGVRNDDLMQLRAYGTPGRDPRGHVISVVFCGISSQKNEIKAADDAKDAKWFPIDDLPELAFDHKKIMQDFVEEILDNPLK
jgi:8-oxo-dGTP diphosphatase